jgi:spore coat polysaccharide biosynthesis protein SpsF
MKIGIIILSRFGSSRLPGKALINVGNDTVLGHVIALAKEVKGVSSVILATSELEEDEILADYAGSRGISVYRGNLDNVFDRFYQCMKTYELDAAIRLNGDSPANNVELLSTAVEAFKIRPQLDLLSNVVERTFPCGVSVEIVSRNAMEKIYHSTLSSFQKEHVTRYIYDNLTEFNVEKVKPVAEAFGGLQMAIDTQTDLSVLEQLFQRFPRPYMLDLNMVASFVEDTRRRLA